MRSGLEFDYKVSSCRFDPLLDDIAGIGISLFLDCFVHLTIFFGDRPHLLHQSDNQALLGYGQPFQINLPSLPNIRALLSGLAVFGGSDHFGSSLHNTISRHHLYGDNDKGGQLSGVSMVTGFCSLLDTVTKYASLRGIHKGYSSLGAGAMVREFVENNNFLYQSLGGSVNVY